MRYPTDPFTTLEFQKLSLDVTEQRKNNSAPDFEAIKQWKFLFAEAFTLD